ncbi:MAG: lipase maturation factor family protein [Myxococcota bacterium]
MDTAHLRDPIWLYHRLTALVLLIAWISLGSQIQLLIGADGLAPIGDLLDRLRDHPDIGFWRFPTHLWLEHSDATLVGGCVVGAVMAAVALVGVRTRLMFALSAPLYLGHLYGAQTFLSFQWDNLLVEMTVLAAMLPEDRRRPWALWAHRLLLLKIMVESGIAKWQSHLGDWQDGSAMGFYYETAPIPAALGWWFHHLPAGWHRFESYWTLFFELIVPFFVFFGPLPRKIAGLIFLGFLVVDTATANYGFFTLQTVALCVLLLEPPHHTDPIEDPPWKRWLGRGVFGLWLGLSVLGGLARFAEIDPLPAVREGAQVWRVANNYHLFGHITQKRIEPEFQTFDGQDWTAHHFWYKPGPLDRAPPYVAPHQPRVDFRLWFYGLGFQRGAPGYVQRLLEQMCRKPSAVQRLFPEPLPDDPVAVRIVYWEYQFTETGPDWWTRTERAKTGVIGCR